MHELAIAEAVARIAARHAAGRRVERVELRLGHLRQVVPSALEFGFELVSQGTTLEGAELVIEDVPARVRCVRCGGASEPEGFPLACDSCGSLDVDVTAGEELTVVALELSDAAAVGEEVRSGS